jgi:mannose-6-phosphate isomerase-like protein (cupin superfamily)
VGIKVVPMAGDEGLSLLAAEIEAGKMINPHYHKLSIEVYFVEDGIGTMKLGNLTDSGGVEWTEVFEVKKGDCFMIEKGQVHSLVNNGEGRLLLVVGCPMSNITTDRFICKAP